MKQGGYCFLCLKEDNKIRNCKRMKGCFYCKGLHNFAICSERDKKDDKKKENSPSRMTSNVPRAKQINSSSVITNNYSNS